MATATIKKKVLKVEGKVKI